MFGSVRGQIAAVRIVIRVTGAASVVTQARPETRAAQTPVVTEVTARPGKMRTGKAAPATEASAHMPATEASAHMPTAEATAHVPAAEPATVSTTATAPARKCISGQSPL